MCVLLGWAWVHYHPNLIILPTFVNRCQDNCFQRVPTYIRCILVIRKFRKNSTRLWLKTIQVVPEHVLGNQCSWRPRGITYFHINLRFSLENRQYFHFQSHCQCQAILYLGWAILCNSTTNVFVVRSYREIAYLRKLLATDGI